MSYREIIRAWQEEEYRTERALLPENPVGLIELADEDLDTAVGGIFQAPNGCWYWSGNGKPLMGPNGHICGYLP